MSTNNKTICAIDIGSNKISCCIASSNVPKENAKIKVLSYYPVSSNSFKNGVINNIENLSNDIGKAIQSAEEMADVKVDDIVVGYPGIMSSSGYTKISVDLEGDIITEQYLNRLMVKSSSRVISEKEDIIHFFPVNYSINGQDGIKKPIGQYADEFSIDIHYVRTNRSFKKNLEKVITKNRMRISSFCSSSYASGLACLTEDEKEIGATVIDIGEETCDISMFKGGSLMYTFSLSGGGIEINKDIKGKLKCSMASAERLKILKGSLKSYNNHSFIEYKEDGNISNMGPSKILTKDFVEVINNRITNLLENCNNTLVDNPFYDICNNIVVITGGVSSTMGMEDLAKKIFNKSVRIGFAQNCNDMPSSYDNPTSVSNIGLIRHGFSLMNESDMSLNKEKNKKIKKIVEWFKESL